MEATSPRPVSQPPRHNKGANTAESIGFWVSLESAREVHLSLNGFTTIRNAPVVHEDEPLDNVFGADKNLEMMTL
jgi:hypothetical protein